MIKTKVLSPIFASLCLAILFFATVAEAQSQSQAQAQAQIQPQAHAERLTSQAAPHAIIRQDPVEFAGTLTFYSHSWGENFPHAFVILDEINEFGQTRSEAFGFTAKSLTPAILMGTVKGHVLSPNARYIRQSDPHFTVPLKPGDAAKINAVRAQWSSGPGSRYHLNKHNCVHFVAEIAHAVGLYINPNSPNFKKPALFLDEVMTNNPTVQPVMDRPVAPITSEPSVVEYERR